MKTLIHLGLVLFLGLALIPAAALAQHQLDFLSDLSDFQDLREMLPTHLKDKAHALLDKRRSAVEKLSTLEDLEKHRLYVRRTMRNAVGGFPERTPLRPRVVGVLERENYTIEKIIFESQPEFYVTANLYIPKGGQAPYPAVLYPLGHERGGKSHGTWQQMLGSLATKGYVALAWDPLGQGERAQIYDEDFKQRKLIRSTTEHTMLGIQCLLVGDSVARYTIWDGIRALDYLVSRPEVDASRIACTGNSGGGTHTAYLSALDDRIKVAAPSCYLTSWSHLLDTIGPQDAEQILLPWIGAGLDHGDFVLAFAPKPYLMLSGIRDFFSISGARATFAEVKGVYERLDAAAKMHKVEGDDPHGYTKPRRLGAYDWFARWLKGERDQRPEPKIAIADFEELKATETGQVATSLGGETVFSLNQKRAAALDKQLPQVASRGDVAAFRDEIRRRVRDVAAISYEPKKVEPVSYGVISRDGYRIEKFTYESEPGILIPTLLFVPETNAARKPAIVYVQGLGKAADAREGGEIEAFAKAGYIVMAPDLRGMGETNTLQDGNGSDFPRYFGQYDSAMTALLIGESLVGMRALDILRGIDLLAARPDVDPQRILGLGKRGGALPLLYAAAVDDRLQRIAVEDSLVSYQAVVDQKLHRRIFEDVIWGVLKSFDLPDLVAAMSPRPVWLVNLTDPLGVQLDLAQVDRTYAPAKQVYAAAGAADAVRVVRRRGEQSALDAYREWLGDQ